MTYRVRRVLALMMGNAARFDGCRRKHRPTGGIEGAVSDSTASWLVTAAAAYLGCGSLFAPWFAWLGVQRVDPVARDSTLGFRLLILPGVVALWPLLALRWAAGSAHPPRETTAHRRRAMRRAPS